MKGQCVSRQLAGVALACALIQSTALAAPRERVRDRELIVKFRTRLAAGAMQRQVEQGHNAASIARTLAAVGRPQTVLVRLPKGASVQEAAARYRALPGVLAVEPNYLGSLSDRAPQKQQPTAQAFRSKDGGATVDPAAMMNPVAAAAAGGGLAAAQWYPNDPNYWMNTAFWWLEAFIIHIEKAPSPLVALLSTGVDPKHPDLARKLLKGTDWVNADTDPDDDNGMGTHSAGQIAALINNKKGVAGISNGKVLVIKIADAEGWGSIFDTAGGILEAANNPLVKVIVVSMTFWDDSTVLRDAVQAAVDNGKLIVAPAGDGNVTDPRYPAYYAHASFPTLSPAVISVAATGLPSYNGSCPGPGCNWYYDFSCKHPQSNYGDWISVDAPGEGLYSTTPTHPFWFNSRWGVPFNYGWLGWTFGATPNVGAVAARIFSYMPPGATPVQVKNRLVSHGWHHVAWGKTKMIDTDGDGVTDTQCHPDAMPDAATMPDVAAAMRRAALYGSVWDAHGAVPLAKPGAVTASVGGAAKGYGGVTPANGAYFTIINLPMNNATPYEVKVNAAKYTAGPVAFDSILLDDCGGGTDTVYCTNRSLDAVSLPKNLTGQFHAVTDWKFYDVDTHGFTPSSAPIKCDVGMWPISSLYCWMGSLSGAPYMRLLHDGGPGNSSDRNSELLSIKGPLYPTAGGTPYQIFLADYGNNFIRSSGARTRIWTGGKIVATVNAASGDTTTNNCTYSGGANVCDAFHIGDLSDIGVFTPVAIYGKATSGAGGVLPYSAMSGSSASGQ